ncbi:MAG: thermonuclease family protein [Alphaproteobacteria bacterium]|nr:thermonuclease family protein [Alphaproteobacteria bacterium]
MFRFVSRTAAFGMLFWAFVCLYPAVDNKHAGPATVIDANTIEVKGEQHRLYGLVKSNRQESVAALTEFLAGQTVKCQLRRKHESADKQFVSTCYAKTEDVSAWMVTNGWALADRNANRFYNYTENEGMARFLHKGIWKKTASVVR